jgi:hypothetical protein
VADLTAGHLAPVSNCGSFLLPRGRGAPGLREEGRDGQEGVLGEDGGGPRRTVWP